MWFSPETGPTRNRTHTPALAGVAAALLLAALVGLTIRHSTFTPWGTDPAAYIGNAHLWARQEVLTPATLIFWAPWSLDGRLETPMGLHPGLTRGTMVSQYPLGFPVLMAAAIRIGGDLAPYVVPPLLAGVLGWCAYVLGSALAGPWAGLLAAIQVAASPITLVHAVVPMSDVPATALWALSWAMSFRGSAGGAAAAGAAAGMAIMVRPNLAPLAAVVGLVILFGDPSPRTARWRRAVIFAACAGVGLAVLLWAQAVLYGHPLTPGYSAYDQYFAFTLERVAKNFRTYPALLVRVHSPAVFAGLVAAPLWFFRRDRTPEARRAAVVVWSALGLISVNYGLYLPYLPFDDVSALRFMLPAMTALFVLNAGLAARLLTWFASYARVLAPVALFLIAVDTIHPRELLRRYYALVSDQQRILLMGRYLREALPRNAVVISYLHAGAIAFYTGRTIVRLDPMEPTSLEPIVGDLRRHGYQPVFVLDEGTEAEWFRYRFESTPYGKLEWTPRATFTRAGATMWYLDPADRGSARESSAAVTDVLR